MSLQNANWRYVICFFRLFIVIVIYLRRLLVGITIAQAVLYLALLLYQTSRVKGSIKIYLIFEFFSFFFINTTYILQDRISFTSKEFSCSECNGKETYTTYHSDNLLIWLAQDKLLSALQSIFTDLRKGFVISIAYDAYIMICYPFDFKEHISSRAIVKRYGMSILLYFAGEFLVH